MSATRLVSVAALVTATVTSSAVTLAAQTSPLDHGARIRVVLGTPPPQTLVGTVAELSGDTLYVQTTDRIHHIPLSTVTTLQVTHGRQGTVLMGALIGAGALGLVGLASGDDQSSGGMWIVHFSAAEKAALGAVTGAGFGALIGAIVRQTSGRPCHSTACGSPPSV